MSKSTSHWLWFTLRAALAILVAVIIYLIYLDATIRDKFAGSRWELPGEVYARPLELYSGRRLTGEDLKAELAALSYIFDGQVAKPGHVLAAENENKFVLHSRGFNFWDGQEAAIQFSVTIRNDVITEMVDSHGRDVVLARLEPLLFERIHPARPEDRVLVQLQEVPELLKNALLVVEDREFYTHRGFRITSMVRAFVANLQAGELSQGGSTITQQLVKNLYLSPSKSLVRKINEVIMSALLELHYDKADILEAYVNEVYLAQDGSRAIHGFGLASEHFFAKRMQDLSVEEIALLVALVKGPSYYSPKRNPERAKARRDLVIGLLAEQGLIQASEARSAVLKPLGLRTASIGEAGYPAYVDLVRRELNHLYDQKALTTEGLRIFTGMDPIIQVKAQRALNEVVTTLAGSDKRLKNLEGAVVITSVVGGEVIAVVGGRNSIRSGFNRALDAVRPIGSLVKPAVYLTALSGDRYTLATKISDEPVTVDPGGGQPLWQPRNYDQKSHGQVMLLDALVNSYNQVTVRLGQQLGVDKVANTIAKLGVSRRLPQVPSLLLGTGEMTPADVSEMYLTLASGGFQKPLRTIRDVVSGNGRVETRFELNVNQSFDSASVYLVNFALREVMRRGTASQVWGHDQTFEVAGKTGTTDDYRDSWFAGFSSQVLAVVWLGNDDNSPTGLTGSSGALRVWSRLMSDIADNPETQGPATGPSMVMWLPIDPDTGLRTQPGCPGSMQIPFKMGTEPAVETRCDGTNEGLVPSLRRLLRGD